MITAVDTNVLLALLYDDAHADAAAAALQRAYRDGKLVITPIVYAELAADGHFETSDDLDQFLADFSIQTADVSAAARFRAGEAFREYTDRRPDGFQCPSCGAEQSIPCASCGTDLTSRQHIAADFLIGGHAAVDCETLLSFDTGFYRSYFPSVSIRPE
ncbi:MAG: type II toxin-antitoxin system VapC family toxin [Halohasta sp.]